MKLAYITDEATQDFEEAVEFATAHCLDGVELRSVQDMTIDRVPPPKLREWKQTLDSAGLAVCCLSSSFYKCSFQDAAQEMEKLERLCDAADLLDCRLIRGFAFFSADTPVPPEKLAEAYARPIELLSRRDKLLLLEADPSVHTTNHRQLADLLARISHPRVRAIYDPGNDLFDPEGERPYPDGYEAIRPYLAHVHIKDAKRQDGEPQCLKIGDGEVGYQELLPRLFADGYDGWLSLETHYRTAARLSERQMRLPQGQSFSQGGMEATAESVEALRALLRAAREGAR